MSKEVEDARKEILRIIYEVPRQSYEKKINSVLETLEEAVTQRTIDEYSERHKP